MCLIRQKSTISLCFNICLTYRLILLVRLLQLLLLLLTKSCAFTKLNVTEREIGVHLPQKLLKDSGT